MTDEKKNIPQSQSKATSSLNASQIREQAEQRAKAMPIPDLDAMTHEIIQQRFHELHVKQIEAELQNEQLRSQLEERNTEAALFRIVTDNMLDMVALTDMKGNFTFVGQSHEILGYDPGCLIGKNVMDFVHPEDLPRILEEFGEFVASGHPRTVEYRNRCRDGSYLWLETMGGFIRDENGNPQKIVFSSRNITERKHAEMALWESEQRFKTIIQNLPGAVFAHDFEGRLLFVNKIASTNTGYSEQELLSMAVTDIDSGSFTQMERFQLWQSLYLGESKTIQSTHTRKDGSTYPVEIHLNAIRLDDQPILLPFVFDITNRIKAKNHLRETSEKLQAILDHSPVLISEFDTNGCYRVVNPAVARMFNRTSAELIGKSFHELLPSDTVEVFMERIEKVVNSGIPVSVEACMPAQEGNLYFNTTLFPLFGPSGVINSVGSIAQDVTDRKRAEDALEHSHDLMRYIIEHANSAVAVHDKDLKYIYVSQQYLDMYRIKKTDVIGRHHYDVFPDLPRKWRDVHQKALAGEVFRREKDSYHREDGTLDWTRWECRPWYEADGSIGGIIVYTEIITERVTAEEALRQSENYYRAIFETSGTAMFIIEEDTTISLVNSNFVELSGYSGQEIEGKKSWTEFVHPDDVAWMKENHYLRRQNPDAVPSRYEFRFITRHEEMRYILLGVGMIPESDKSIASCIDITERKQAEEDLAEQHALIEAIYRNAPLIMMVVDSDLCLRQVNGFATQFTGRPAEEMLGLRGGEALRCLHALDDPQGCGFGEVCKNCSIRNKVLETLENGMPNLQIEVSFDFSSRNNSQALTLLISTTPIIFHGQSMALVTIMDITDRKQAEKEREKLQSQLNQAQKMEFVGRLAGGVAHDFNNMLAIINGYAEMSLKMTDPADPLYDNIREIYNAGTRSADIVRQLLAFARQQTISPVQLDLNDAISSMIKMLQRLIGENLDLAWHPGKSLWPVKIDPSQVDQVMANLAVNARDAISDVGKLTIETKNTIVDEVYCNTNPDAIPGRYVMLAVSDDGHGMKKEVMDQLFEPFFTTKEIGKGTGLGLPTIYGIVKQNKGFVNVYSEPGEGTTFKIYLPSHEAEKPFICPSKESEGQMPMGTETILLVEDEPAILKMGKEMIERLGYTVLTAEKPNDAFRVVLEYDGKIDLLITDVIMPELNGRDLSLQLTAGNPDLKTLFMSGYTAKVIAHHGVLDEGVQFIQKPFSLKDLAVKVREAIEQE